MGTISRFSQENVAVPGIEYRRGTGLDGYAPWADARRNDSSADLRAAGFGPVAATSGVRATDSAVWVPEHRRQTVVVREDAGRISRR